MKIIITILYAIVMIAFCNNCLAQDYPTPDSTTNKFIIKLQQKGIDTICIYQSYYPGAILSIKQGEDTTCINSDYVADTYFLWRQKGITYLTLKTRCFDYDTIKINGNKLWAYYLINKTNIRIEKTKKFQYIAIKNGERKIETVFIDHSDRQELTLIIDKRDIKFLFDSFDFEKMSDDMVNINYQYNLNTKAKKLQILLSDLINTNDKRLKKIK